MALLFAALLGCALVVSSSVATAQATQCLDLFTRLRLTDRGFQSDNLAMHRGNTPDDWRYRSRLAGRYSGVPFALGPHTSVEDRLWSEQRFRAMINEFKDQSISPEFLRFIDRIFSPTVRSDGTIFIRFRYWNSSSLRGPDGAYDQVARSIYIHFLRSYQENAAYVYQTEGLEPYDPMVSARMHDEDSAYGVAEFPLTYHMAFDAPSWQMHLRFLEHQWNKYLKSPGDIRYRDRNAMEEQIPFFPLAGIAIAQSLNDPDEAIEAKRYFKTSVQDPLHILPPSSHSPGDLKQILTELQLYAFGFVMMPDVSVEIHSHTLRHTRAYQRLGFQVVGALTNPRYPTAKIDLLRAKVEVVRERLKSQLQKPAGASQEPLNTSRGPS